MYQIYFEFQQKDWLMGIIIFFKMLGEAAMVQMYLNHMYKFMWYHFIGHVVSEEKIFTLYGVDARQTGHNISIANRSKRVILVFEPTTIDSWYTSVLWHTKLI